MKYLILCFTIFLLVLFWSCGKDSNPIVQQSVRMFDPYALWDTASFTMLGDMVQGMLAVDTFLFAGTSNQSVYRSTNNGDDWFQFNSGLPAGANVRALLVLDTNIFAGTSTGVYKSTDFGENWILSSTGMTTTSTFALTVKDSFIFAGTSNSAFRSSDDGASWLSAGLSGATVTSFAVRGSRLFAGTTGNGILRSTNNGTSWQSISSNLPPAPVYAIAVQDANLFAAMDSYGVYRSTNDSSWAPANEGLYTFLSAGGYPRSFFIYGPNILLGLSSDFGVCLSINHGSSWISANSGLPYFYANCFTSNGSFIFVGGQTMPGAVYRHGF